MIGYYHLNPNPTLDRLGKHHVSWEWERFLGWADEMGIKSQHKLGIK